MFGLVVNHSKQPIVTVFLYVAISLFCAFTGVASADEDEVYQKVIIADPYIDMHTGPGRGYPIFYVAERGAEIIILKSKTSWYKVRLKNKKEGWVNRSQLRRTLTPEGEQTEIVELAEEDYLKRKWEIGVMSGDAEGFATMTLYGTYAFSKAMAVEFSVSQFLGDLAGGFVWSADIVSQPFTDWWISPYFALGTGQIEITPNTTLIQAPDIKDNHAHIAVGAKMYITQRFLFRAEYRNYKVFQSRPVNEEIEEWRAGFAFFF
jgi:hypothetical protein